MRSKTKVIFDRGLVALFALALLERAGIVLAKEGWLSGISFGAFCGMVILELIRFERMKTDRDQEHFRRYMELIPLPDTPSEFNVHVTIPADMQRDTKISSHHMHCGVVPPVDHRNS